MSVIFPAGTTAVPLTADLSGVLDGPRTVDYRFDLLDRNENLVGTLKGVEPTGELTWDYNASIKCGGTLTVTDLNEHIDWLNVRIRPVMKLEGAGVLEQDDFREVSLGVFLPAAPAETWSATGRVWAVELLDKNCILDQDIVTDDAGQPVVFSVPTGTNIIDVVKRLIIGAGEKTPAIVSGGKTLLRDMTWDMGTTRLKIINDLLDMANYFSLWCDGAGQYQVTPYLLPEDRPAVYALRTPFSKGDFSLMSPDWARDRDIYSIPNRYVAISQGDGDTASLVSVATNLDPASPFSYQSRGRWITQVLTGAEAASPADLDAIARRGLQNATAVAGSISVRHLYLPEVMVNRAVRFINPDAGLDTDCYVTKTTVPFNPMELCSSTLREAR